MARTLNVGILAHVDAGKTSLTERLLYAAGAVDELGSVDDGTTHTDSLALERRRGITIRSAVASYAVADLTVNIIDTPGHPDFIAEVERVLRVLDGAVLVVSAVEGVQAQTRILMRTLQRLRVPTLVFVNKIDRGGADIEQTMRAITNRLSPAVIAMSSTHAPGTPSAVSVAHTEADTAFVAGLAELVADHDADLLAAYVDDESAIPHRVLHAALAAQTGRAQVHPVYFGSAITGAGVDDLVTGIAELLPAADGDPDGPVSGSVFTIERGPAGERIAYVRMFSGTVRTRDRVDLPRGGVGKVTAVGVTHVHAGHPHGSVSAGQIGRLRGLGDVRVGDSIGVPPAGPAGYQFAPPTLETVIAATSRPDEGALHMALTQLAEQDPLINLRRDDLSRETFLSLYGEVQKEVIQTTLATDYDIDVTFRDTTTICIERPVGTGAAAEFMGHDDNPFRATVGVRIDPARVGTGVRFALEVERGSLPYAFLRAVEETVRQTLRQGLHGWEVTDCTVTMTHSGYTPPPPYGWSASSSSAGDFRNLTPLVLMDALAQAGTTVYEPIHRFSLEIPTDTFGSLLPVLERLRAVPGTPVVVNASSSLVEGDIPAAHIHLLQQRLPTSTHGEGVMESSFDRYEPVRGAAPTRARSDRNPLHREEYLLAVAHRVPGR